MGKRQVLSWPGHRLPGGFAAVPEHTGCGRVQLCRCTPPAVGTFPSPGEDPSGLCAGGALRLSPGQRRSWLPDLPFPTLRVTGAAQPVVPRICLVSLGRMCSEGPRVVPSVFRRSLLFMPNGTPCADEPRSVSLSAQQLGSSRALPTCSSL